MHQSTLYAILAALTAVHAVPVTEEFRVHRRECLIVGGCGPTESLETPMPIIARRWFEPEPSMEEPGFVGPKKTRSEPLEVDGTTSIILPVSKKRMCAGNGCDLPIEPLDKRIVCSAAQSIAGKCGDLPYFPIETPIAEPITALKEKRVICRLAEDGTTEGECGELPIEPIETPIAEGPIAKTKAANKRVVCPLNADGTASECSEPIVTPISELKKQTKKKHAASSILIRPVPAAQTAAPVKVRGESLEVVGTVPLQTQPQTKPGHANPKLVGQKPSLSKVKDAAKGRRSSTLETNLQGGAISSHTDADGNTVVKVAGAVKNPTLTTRIVAATTAPASAATVAAKGLAPVAIATAGVTN